MTITIASIEAAAPDQASLKAASKLLSPAKWPEREITHDGALIWGACQGSGANPYRVAVDLSDLGAKCSCPSRKFPCKHAIALMLQYESAPAEFAQAEVQEWISEWMGRRRKATGTNQQTGESKSLAKAQQAEEVKPDDPKTKARKAAATTKRAENTRKSVTEGLQELEGWISDQLRTGLSELLGDLTSRCRRIASRLVDAKAGSLAGRIDGIPARVLDLPQESRADALIAELGKLVILIKAWGDGQNASPSVRREITSGDTREALLEDCNALRQTGIWEVLSSRDETRRDGLIARSTWLLKMASDIQFALLLDFFPANLGKRGGAFAPGERFQAELVFYPAGIPMRAQIVARSPALPDATWPEPPQTSDVLSRYSDALSLEPWILGLPLLLPKGQLAEGADQLWWGSGKDDYLPIINAPKNKTVIGTELNAMAVFWNGYNASILAADTNLGRYHPDE